MSKPQTARSYRGSIIDDNFAINLNIKWAIQVLVAISALIYGWFQVESRIADLEKNMDMANAEIADLVSRHIAEEQTRYTEMEESLKWYESELVKVGGVSLNPLNWGQKNRR